MTGLNTSAKAAWVRRSRGIPGYTPARPVTAHLRRLLAAGWTRQEIAAAARVSPRTVYGLLRHERPGIQHDKAARLLALRPGDAPGLVCAAGTMRRLQALAAIGWPVTRTARDAGVAEAWARGIAGGQHQRINRNVADAIAAVYRARCMQPGPSRLARSVAARNGWVTGLAWDDIDNPDEQPTGLGKDAA